MRSIYSQGTVKSYNVSLHLGKRYKSKRCQPGSHMASSAKGRRSKPNSSCTVPSISDVLRWPRRSGRWNLWQSLVEQCRRPALGIKAKQEQRTQTAGQHRDGASRAPKRKPGKPRPRKDWITEQKDKARNKARERRRERSRRNSRSRERESSNVFDDQPSVEHWKNERMLSIEKWLTQ